MSQPSQSNPFHLQPVLTNLYPSTDLLDLSTPSPSTSSLPVPIPVPVPSDTSVSATGTASPTASPTPASIFSSATQYAAAAGRRAAAVASAAASPVTGQTAAFRGTSPEKSRDAGGLGAVAAGASTSSGVGEVRCVEGYAGNLYIGGSDGVVEWWTCDGSSVSENGWTMRHRHTLFPRRAVSRIFLLPKVSKAFILSDSTLHPLSLPGLEPIPSSVVPPMRGVVSVVFNDDELDWSGQEEKGAEMTVVVVRRKGLGIYKLGTRFTAVKEIPLPVAPTHHALFSTYLCAAIPSEAGMTYSIIDLSDASLTEVLPVSQIDPSGLDFEPNPNVVVIPGENEFLVTSFTGAGTMGVFLNGQGDPERGTIEWADHPLALAVESGFVIALLRNQTVAVHALSDLEKPVQVVTLLSDAVTLSYSPYGVSVRDVTRDERMALVRVNILGQTAEAAPAPAIAPHDLSLTVGTEVQEITDTSIVLEEPMSGSGLTPPSSPPLRAQQSIPRRGSSLSAKSPSPFSTAVAETLVVGTNTIHSLVPMPSVLRLEQLCAERRMDDAIALVDEERRKGRRGEVDVDKATHAATLKFLNLYLACHLFLETVFERAGEYFARGKIDPRLVVRLFPSFRGKTIGSAEDVEIFEGLEEVLVSMSPVEDIIAKSIKANYSPYVQPNSSTAPETTSLRLALFDSAKSMLTEFLRKTRASRRKGGGSRGVDSRKIDIVIDTTLAKLLADGGLTAELQEILAGPNDVVLAELEPFLANRKYVLSTVMKQQGRVNRVLELLKEIAEDPKPDPLCEKPIDELAQQLEAVKDPILVRKYGLWLVQRDHERGIQILLTQGAALDGKSLVDDLRAINEDAANRYLEHVVVDRRSPDTSLHESLLGKLLDTVAELVKDDGIKYHLEELDSEYRLMADPQAFPVFFADIAPPTPIKTSRLKLILFLQGSPFINLSNALARLEQVKELAIERAIILGRLGRDRQALQILARDIADPVSAQTYCTQGGEIVPPKVARMIAAYAPELTAWAILGDVGRKRRGTVDAQTQQGLVTELLKVYVNDGPSRHATALLNAQSVHLDVMEVLPFIPAEWPVDVVSKFYQRSLRRQTHDRATWHILKSISAGQNLQTSEEYLDRVTALVPVVQHGPSPGTESLQFSVPDEGSIAEKEYASYEMSDKEGSGESGGGKNEEGKELGVGKGVGEKPTDGFFVPEAVDKELEQLSRTRRGDTPSARV